MDEKLKYIHENCEIYLINLDRSPDRLKSMDKKLKNLGLVYKRIRAVDGKQQIFTPKEVSNLKFILAHGKSITPTEVACFMSHYNTMNEFISNSSKPIALIIEDDMCFSSDFIDVLKSLIEKSEYWDLVKLNDGHQGGKVKKIDIADGVCLKQNYFHQSKTGSYILNRKAAKNYVKKLLPMFVPIDHEFIKFWKYKVRGYSLSPLPAWEEGVESTIDYKQVKRNRKSFVFRIPSKFYKSYIAIRRLVWCFFKI